jgi:hypothetical protein
MQNIKKNIIITLVLIVSVTVFAQAQPKKNNGGGLESTTRADEKDFDVTLNETERVKVDLSLPALDTTVKNQNYNLSTRNFKVDYAAPKIRPIGMGSDKKDKNDKEKKGYVKLGYGIPHSPYGELGYSFSNKDADATFSLRHHSMNNKNVAFQKFSETGGKLNLGYHLNKEYAVGAKIGYNQNSYFAYGSVDSITGKLAQAGYINPLYKQFNIGFSIYNTERNDLDMTYMAGIEFANKKDNNATKENHTQIKLQATKWFGEKHPLSLLIHTDYSKMDFLNASRKETLNNIYIVPSFTFHADAFSIKAGMNLVTNNDEWSPMPDLEATVSVLGDRLAIFGGWKGDMQKNTFQTLSDYNPYVLSTLQDNLNNNKRLQNTKYQDYFGGVKGHWGAVDYNVQGGYKPTTNLAFFNQNAQFLYSKDSRNGRFDVLYGNANITYVKGSITAKVKSFEIGGTVSQNIYTMKTSTIQSPWHLPSTEINGLVAYRLLEDKLKLKGQVFFQNGIPYLGVTGKAESTAALLDLSIGTEYNFNSNFGLFLNLNNLLNQKRARWYNYPSYGMNVLGGLVARF